MVTLILLLILSVGSQVGASDLDLDAAFNSFLESSSTGRFFQDNAIIIKSLFKQYQEKFNRLPTTVTEEKTRFAAFNETVLSLLKDHQQGSKTYSVGLNQLADRTQEELSKRRGLQIPKGEIKSTNAEPNQRFRTLEGNGVRGKSDALPTSYDYTARVITGTNTPVINPVKDQGGCGSCYAFAFVVLLEAQYAFQLKSAANLSEQQIVDCSQSDLGCNGGYFTNTFSYIKTNAWQSNSGISYPYKQRRGSCVFKSAGGGGVKFKSLLYKAVAPNNAAAMQQSLIDYGPLWVSVYVGDGTTSAGTTISRTFSSYTSGVFRPSRCPTSLSTTNHAVVIVGYGVDSQTNIPYWKVKNSWSNQWGEQGYFRIQRGVNMCGIESQPYYIAEPA